MIPNKCCVFVVTTHERSRASGLEEPFLFGMVAVEYISARCVCMLVVDEALGHLPFLLIWGTFKLAWGASAFLCLFGKTTTEPLHRKLAWMSLGEADPQHLSACPTFGPLSVSHGLGCGGAYADARGQHHAREHASCRRRRQQRERFEML